MAKKAGDKPTISVQLPLSEARARAKEALGSLEFAQSSIIRWLTSVSDQLRFGARVIDGVLPGEILKGMTRKKAEAEALRDLFGPGKFNIDWEESWVRRQAGAFVYTAYGVWVDADDFEARLSALLQAPASKPAGNTDTLKVWLPGAVERWPPDKTDTGGLDYIEFLQAKAPEEWSRHSYQNELSLLRNAGVKIPPVSRTKKF
jgi:hypothetical protein